MQQAQPGSHSPQSSSARDDMASPGGAQQLSPCQAWAPSRRARAAITRATSGSDHDQPSVALATRPSSNTADRYVQMSVCFESATADAEPNSRPVRRYAYDSTGMTATEIAARRSRPRPRKTPKAKKETAMTLSARCSRASRTAGSRAENCHATAAAEDTSITESNPNPTNAVDDAIVPAVIATTASTML